MDLTVFLYIDPASGSILLQAAFATVVGTLAFFRHSLWRIASCVLRRRRSSPSPDESTGKES